MVNPELEAAVEPGRGMLTFTDHSREELSRVPAISHSHRSALAADGTSRWVHSHSSSTPACLLRDELGYQFIPRGGMV